MDGALEVLTRYGYLIVIGSVFAEQVGVPVPAIPMLLAAGALIGAGKLDPFIVILGSGVASLVADAIWYGIGRWGGARVLGWLCRISLEPDSCVRKTARMFDMHGARSLLVAKFIPGFSTVAPPLAGIVRMPLRHFLLFSGLGGLLWVGAFVGVGRLFSSQLELVLEYAAHMGRWALAAIAIGFGSYIAWKFVSRQRFLRKIRIARITPEELKRQLDEGQDVMLVDVRDRLDFESEPMIIPGALHLSTDELEARHLEIPRERDIVLYCT